MTKVIIKGHKRSNKSKKDPLNGTMGFFEGDKDLSEYGEKRRTAYKKVLESRNAFLKAGVSSERVYRESKEQLEKRPLKRNDQRRHKRKVKTIFGTLPKLDISIDEAIEKAIEIVARERGKR